MGRVRIEFYKNKCVGRGNCASIDPQRFQLIGEKAKLNNSWRMENGADSLELECNKETMQNIIDAGNACPVNAIGVTDLERDAVVVSVKVLEQNTKEVIAEYDDEKEFVLDNAGYFLIRIDSVNKNIEVAFCNERNKIVLKVIGKNPIEIYQTILNKEKLDIRKDHAAYLGRELQKAHIALKSDLEYIQDDELKIS